MRALLLRLQRTWILTAQLMTLWALCAIKLSIRFCLCKQLVSLRCARHTRGTTKWGDHSYTKSTKLKKRLRRWRKKWPRASYCLVTFITIKLSWHFSVRLAFSCPSISFTHWRTNRVSNRFVCSCFFPLFREKKTHSSTWLNIASNNNVVDSIYSSVGIIPTMASTTTSVFFYLCCAFSLRSRFIVENGLGTNIFPVTFIGRSCRCRVLILRLCRARFTKPRKLQ